MATYTNAPYFDKRISPEAERRVSGSLCPIVGWISDNGPTCRFEPAVERVMEAAGRMRMGQVCRLTMIFKKRLWPEEMSFLFARELAPSVWWTARPAEAKSLTGWVGGPRTKELLGLGAEELKTRAIAAAAKALGVAENGLRENLEGFYSYDWSADENVLGAYSWVPVGGLEASREMSEAVGGVLYFAGEHTDTTGHWGTVHAALRSGRRAAEQILKEGELSSIA